MGCSPRHSFFHFLLKQADLWLADTDQGREALCLSPQPRPAPRAVGFLLRRQGAWPIGDLPRPVGQMPRLSPAVGAAEAAGAEDRGLGRGFRVAAIAFALVQVHHRAVLAGDRRGRHVERRAVEDRDGARRDAHEQRVGEQTAAAQQQQGEQEDTHGGHPARQR